MHVRDNQAISLLPCSSWIFPVFPDLNLTLGTIWKAFFPHWLNGLCMRRLGAYFGVIIEWFWRDGPHTHLNCFFGVTLSLVGLCLHAAILGCCYISCSYSCGGNLWSFCDTWLFKFCTLNYCISYISAWAPGRLRMRLDSGDGPKYRVKLYTWYHRHEISMDEWMVDEMRVREVDVWKNGMAIIILEGWNNQKNKEEEETGIGLLGKNIMILFRMLWN